MENKLILIRLLKAGHVSEEEFISLYEAIIGRWVSTDILADEHRDNLKRLGEGHDNPFPNIWHGTNHPTTGEPMGPTYSVAP